MRGYRAGILQAFAHRIMIPAFAVSGFIVALSFFFPSLVGSSLPGRGLLLVALVFFGSGLVYLAMMPDGEPERVADRHRDRAGRAPGLRAGVRRFLAEQDSVVFGVSVASLVLFVVIRLLGSGLVQGFVAGAKSLLLLDLGWLFLGTMFLFVLFCLFLLVGPWGKIKLGGPETEPSFTYPAYFAMVFSAGIAAGIVFWGPAEALFHYDSVPPLVAAEPRSAEAMVGGLQYAFFHWGISAWSAYVVFCVPIAHFVYNHGAPLKVSTLLVPFLGSDGLDSPWAKLVDILAVFATIGGLSTSVGLVSEQFLTGIEYQWGVQFGSLEPVLFVGGLTLIFTIAAATGVRRGIRRIAAANVSLYGLFLLLVLGIAPLGFILNTGSAALAGYARDFVPMSLFVGGEWGAGWTIWNWSWWFSWAPFAGLFLAALSKGRRIRTVVFTGVVATSMATLVWFVLVGGLSLHLQHSGAVDILGVIADYGGAVAVVGYPLFETLPLGRLLIFLFLGLIITFIVTSAATSTLVVSILTVTGDAAPSTATRAFWGVFQGVIGVGVLLVGADALQAMAVLTGGPLAIVSLVAIVGTSKTFRESDTEGGSLLADARRAIANRRS